MTAADLAPLPIAPLVLVVLADLVFSLGHLDRLGLPERERVDRAGGPAPTGGAMAVASAHRIARDDNRDGAAEALTFEGLFILAHEFSLSLECKADLDRGYSDQVVTSGHHLKGEAPGLCARPRGKRLCLVRGSRPERRLVEKALSGARVGSQRVRRTMAAGYRRGGRGRHAATSAPSRGQRQRPGCRRRRTSRPVGGRARLGARRAACRCG